MKARALGNAPKSAPESCHLFPTGHSPRRFNTRPHMYTQIPGGWAAQQYGGRIMLLLCFASWSAASILTPTNARHTYAIVAARVAVRGALTAGLVGCVGGAMSAR